VNYRTRLHTVEVAGSIPASPTQERPANDEKRQPTGHASGKVAAGDLTHRVGLDSIEARGVNVEDLVEKLIDAAGAEYTTYYYNTILQMNLAARKTTRRSARTPGWRTALTSSLSLPESTSSAANFRPISTPLRIERVARMLTCQAILA
jgi:hypothetical protein